jgi:hypothetical protein
MLNTIRLVGAVNMGLAPKTNLLIVRTGVNF